MICINYLIKMVSYGSRPQAHKIIHSKQNISKTQISQKLTENQSSTEAFPQHYTRVPLHFDLPAKLTLFYTVSVFISHFLKRI